MRTFHDENEEPRSFRTTIGRDVLGMPGPVWTMALWFAASCVILAASVAFPMNPQANPTARGISLVIAVVGLVTLLVLRGRTPTWLLYAGLLVAVVMTEWIILLSVKPTGTVTSSLSLIAIASYAGFWLPRRTGLVLVSASTVGYLVVLVLVDGLPELLIPWLLVTALCFGLLVSFGTVVAHLQREAVTDQLTGLLNRHGLFELIALHGGSGRVVQPRTLVLIDLDDFKAINDRHGHVVGDRILREFGAALRIVIRPDDMAFRTGGDEFLLVLPATSEAGARGLVRRLREVITVSFSCGVTGWASNEELDVAMARADRRMYEDKSRPDDDPLPGRP